VSPENVVAQVTVVHLVLLVFLVMMDMMVCLENEGP